MVTLFLRQGETGKQVLLSFPVTTSAEKENVVAMLETLKPMSKTVTIQGAASEVMNLDKVFGTFVETDENDHALNIYANYDMQRQQVCDTLEITLYGSGIDDQSLTYHLNAAEKEVLREKMEAYCMQREHKPLNQLCQEILQEQDAPTQEMQL